MNTPSTVRCLTAGLLMCLVASLAAAQQAAKTDAYQDPLPQGAIARLGTSRLMAGYVVNGGLNFTSDGKKLISLASLDRFSGLLHAQIWDAQTGKLLYASPEPKDDYRRVAISPDGKLLAVNGPDGLVLLNAQTGEKVLQFGDEVGKPMRYQSIAFTPDGSKLLFIAPQAVGLANIFWDVKTGKKLFTLPPSYYGLALSPDGKLMAQLEHNEQGLKIHIFDADGAELKTIQLGKPLAIAQLALAGDGMTLAVCMPPTPQADDKEETVSLWNTKTGEKIRSFAGYSPRAYAITMSADAKVLAIADYFGTIRIFDATNGSILQTFRNPGMFGPIALSPDGSRLAAAGQINGAIRILDAKTGKQFFTDRGHQGPINAVAIHPNGKQIATASQDGTVRLWDAADGKQLMQLDIPAPKIDTASQPASANAPASMPTLAAATTSARAAAVPDATISVVAVAFSPDGSTLAASTGNQIIIWQLPSGGLVGTLATGTTGATKLKFSPDGKNIISTSSDESTLVWDVAQQKLLQTLPKAGDFTPPLYGAPIMTVRDRSVDPSGQFGVCVWSVWPAGYEAKPGLYATIVEQYTLQPIAELTIQPRRSMACWGTAAFSPNARRLATAGCDEPTVAIWDIPALQKIGDFNGHVGVVLSMAFNPSGKTLVSASQDGTAVVWDVDAVTKRSATASAPATKPSDLAALLADLGDEDAAKAFAATWTMIDLQDKATDFLATKLTPVAKADPAAVKQIVADLDSERFSVRKKAADNLAKLGPGAISAMKDALTNASSTEVKTAIESFLSSQELPAANRLNVRAMYVLERIGTDKAKLLLKSLADGLADAPLTKQAKASLDRLNSSAK